MSSPFLAAAAAEQAEAGRQAPGPVAARVPSGDGSLLRSGMARRRAGFEFSASRLAARSSGELGSPPPGPQPAPLPLPARGPVAGLPAALPAAGLPPGRPPLGFFFAFFLALF